METPFRANVSMAHLLTFDLEHWYEGYRYRRIPGWERHAGRDHRTVEALLGMLDEHRVKATFFATGRFATEFPSLIFRVAELGHEVASHSYSHEMVHRFGSLQDFREDLHRSLTVLRGIVGDAVIGYRAPKWSLPTRDRSSFFDVLIDNGLRYDSSLYPMGRTQLRYPFPVSQRRNFWEIPAGTLSVGGFNVPAAGGLWLRLWPEAVSNACLRQAERNKQPGTVYLHPYDLDVDCPRLSVGGHPGRWLFAFARHYNLDKGERFLRNLLARFHFTAIRDWLVEID